MLVNMYWRSQFPQAAGAFANPFARSGSIFRFLRICEAIALDDRSNRPYRTGMEQRNPDTQAHILSIGRRLTAKSGYAGVGLNELLKEAGVPKGSFYHYFPSKEAYGIALLREFADDYEGKLTQTLNHPGKDARSRLIAYFTQWRKQQTSDVPEERCLVVKLSAEVADLSPEMSRILEQSVQAIVDHLAKTLREGVADGSIGAHEQSKELAATIYYLWLGASLVAGLSDRNTALTSALRATKALIPAR